MVQISGQDKVTAFFATDEAEAVRRHTECRSSLGLLGVPLPLFQVEDQRNNMAIWIIVILSQVKRFL